MSAFRIVLAGLCTLGGIGLAAMHAAQGGGLWGSVCILGGGVLAAAFIAPEK